MLKILMVASEYEGLAKTGGLADAVAGLARALAETGHDVRLVLPRYRDIPVPIEALHPVVLPALCSTKGPAKPFATFETRKGGHIVYLLDQTEYFSRSGLYGSGGREFGDNAERFAFLAWAALALAKQVGFQPDVVHAHDWQGGLVPTYLKTLYSGDTFFDRTASVFTIHNLSYQGRFSARLLPALGLPLSEFHLDGIEFFGDVSFLKAGLMYADGLTTVSPTYAREIQTAAFGCGLHGVLRHRAHSLAGVLNGLGPLWNPECDCAIPQPFGPERMAGKAVCKSVLQQELDLGGASQAPLLGAVTRLVEQKGIDLAIAAAEAAVAGGAQFAVLGQGEAIFRDQLNRLAKRWPRQIAFVDGFDDGLAHRIIAGADIFIMPSRFEPCGLTQMAALRYGTIPVVTPVGGLWDSVIPTPELGAHHDAGTGFVAAGVGSDDFVQAVGRALLAYRSGGESWSRLVRRCMAKRFNWDSAAEQYLAAYQRALAKREACESRLQVSGR